MSNQNQNNRQSGTVKWFNLEKGYGFIAPANGTDVFVHITAVQNAGLNTLNDGQAVTFVPTPGKNGKTSAEDLQLA